MDNEEAVRAGAQVVPSRAHQPQLWPSTGEYPVYDRYLYYALTHDRPRCSLFERAMTQVVPGKSVVDLGAGEDLNWARYALSAGAARAVAIEALEDAYTRALRKVDAAPVDGDLEILFGDARSVRIRDRCDVLVSETIGSIAGSEGAEALITQARSTLLLPDGVVIPHLARTMGAAACFAGLMNDEPLGFSRLAMRYLTKIFAWHGSPFDVRLGIALPELQGLFSTPVEMERLSFNAQTIRAHVGAQETEIIKSGAIDGVLLWIRLTCIQDGDELDALESQSSWGAIFVPVFDVPVPTRLGDTVVISMDAIVSDDGVHPDYLVGLSLRRGRVTVKSGKRWSRHHGGDYRQGALYERLWGGPTPKDESTTGAADLDS